MTSKVFYSGYTPNGGTLGALAFYTDGTSAACLVVPITVGLSDTAATIMAAVPGAVNAFCVTNIGSAPSSGEWVFNPLAAVSKTFTNPSRSLNTAFQPSTASDTLGTYSVTIASSLSLTTGQLGSVVLEYADDSSFTTNVKTASQLSNGNTGTLVIGLNTVNTQGGVISGIVPANKWARLRTVNTTGTPTITSVAAQEVQF